MALVVITGGARSGKSSAAERLALRRAAEGSTVSVVVFGRQDADDPEFAERVARHQADRPAHFATLEARDAASWRDEAGSDTLLVVDCMGTLLGRVMEEAWEACAATTAGASGDMASVLGEAPSDALPPDFGPECDAALAATVDWLLAREGDTIVVTNEVGDGLVPTYATGRLFRDLLGRANRRLVDSADAGYLAVAGRLIALDGLSRDAAWPED